MGGGGKTATEKEEGGKDPGGDQRLGKPPPPKLNEQPMPPQPKSPPPPRVGERGNTGEEEVEDRFILFSRKAAHSTTHALEGYDSGFGGEKRDLCFCPCKNTPDKVKCRGNISEDSLSASSSRSNDEMKHGSCRLATAFLSAGRRRGRTRTAIPIFKKSLLSPRIIQATVKDERREAAAAAEEKEEEERLISILTGEQEEGEGDSKRSAAEKRGEQTKNPKKSVL